MHSGFERTLICIFFCVLRVRKGCIGYISGIFFDFRKDGRDLYHDWMKGRDCIYL